MAPEMDLRPRPPHCAPSSPRKASCWLRFHWLAPTCSLSRMRELPIAVLVCAHGQRVSHVLPVFGVSPAAVSQCQPVDQMEVVLIKRERESEFISGYGTAEGGGSHTIIPAQGGAADITTSTAGRAI